MSLMRAFTVMLRDVTSADASARQVNGILGWREYAHEAVRRGEGLPCSPSRAVLITDSSTHARWKVAAEAILEDLREQAGDADRLYAEKTAEAEDQDRQADAAESEAASAEAEAAELMLAAEANAATVIGVAAAAICVAQAAECGAIAAAARARAEECRRRAAEAREVADQAMAWGIAARDAITTGERLIAGEDTVAIPVGEAIAAAGGLPEVYGTKRALTMDGGNSRPLAIRGGAR